MFPSLACWSSQIGVLKERKRRYRQVCWGWVLWMLATASMASGQISGGGIRGTVTDPSGSAVPRAGITLENVGTNERWTLLSSSAGLYSATSLPVGRYTVTVKAPGFATAERTSIDVE